MYCRRADVDTFLDEIGHRNYAEIHALRRLENVAHDREVWIAAVQALFVAESMSKVTDREGWLNTFVEAATGRKQKQQLATPEEMARAGRGGNR